MIIKELITLAKFSELSGVAVKDNTEAIVAFINLGMIEIYGRFPVKTEEHIIEVVSGTSLYTTPSNFLYATDAYIEAPEDSDEEFTSIGINDEDDEFSIFFTSWNTVKVPESLADSSVYLKYSSKPSSITIVQAKDGITELDLPDTLIDCLLSYLGYRGHLGVKSDSQSENNAQWARFERNCKKAKELGIAYPAYAVTMNERINDRGFV